MVQRATELARESLLTAAGSLLRMTSKPKRPQGLVFAKKESAVDVAGVGRRWKQQAAFASRARSGSPPHTKSDDVKCFRFDLEDKGKTYV